MKKSLIIILAGAAILLSACNSYNNVLRAEDYEYRYEAAKEYYAAGQYTRCYQLLEDMVLMLKGTDKGEECLYMLAMCYYNLHDYETSSLYLDKYFKTYPKGTYTELARFFSGKASYLDSPDSRLDQTSTLAAIQRLQEYLEFYPYSERREEVNDMIYQLQNKLAEKEYDAAKLYYNLGNYVGNCVYGGNNYEACIITAENTLKNYPYTVYREELIMLVLRSRYRLALNSVDEKVEERYRSTIDEYYGFKNEFPDSKYTKEADQIFRHCSEKVKG